jgi:hypothetical protein
VTTFILIHGTVRRTLTSGKYASNDLASQPTNVVEAGRLRSFPSYSLQWPDSATFIDATDNSRLKFEQNIPVYENIGYHVGLRDS